MSTELSAGGTICTNPTRPFLFRGGEALCPEICFTAHRGARRPFLPRGADSMEAGWECEGRLQSRRGCCAHFLRTLTACQRMLIVKASESSAGLPRMHCKRGGPRPTRPGRVDPSIPSVLCVASSLGLCSWHDGDRYRCTGSQ